MGQRVIPCAITAEYVAGDGVTLGAAGSHSNVVIEFDFRAAGPMWEGTTKYVLWTNPQGNSTNRVDLGVDKLVDGYDNVYHASPTADSMCVAGWAEMVVVGVTVETTTDEDSEESTTKEVLKVKTEPSRFRVLPGSSRASDNEGIAATVADQLQTEIESVERRKVNKPVDPYDADGEPGQVLESLGGGKTRWRDETVATEEMVENVLERHKDWVTTVQDGSISEVQLTDKLVQEIKKKRLIANVSFLHEALENCTSAESGFGTCCVMWTDDTCIVSDFGDSDDGSTLVDFLTGHGIRKVDAVIVSHYHYDHINGKTLNALVNSDIDLSSCVFYLPHKYINWGRFIGTSGTSPENIEANVKDILTSNQIQYTEPAEEGETAEVGDFTLTFYNLDPAFYPEYYEYKWYSNSAVETDSTRYNNFSMCCNVNIGGTNIFLTGDIEEAAQNNMALHAAKADVFLVPHHGRNLYESRALANSLSCRVGVITPYYNPSGGSVDGILTLTAGRCRDLGTLVSTQNRTVSLVIDGSGVYADASNDMQNGKCLGNILRQRTDFDALDYGDYFCSQLADIETFVNAPPIASERNATFLLHVIPLNNGATKTTRKVQTVEIRPAEGFGTIRCSRIKITGAWTSWAIEGLPMEEMTAIDPETYRFKLGTLNPSTVKGLLPKQYSPDDIYEILTSGLFAIAETTLHLPSGVTTTCFVLSMAVKSVDLQLLRVIHFLMPAMNSSTLYMHRGVENENHEITWTEWKSITFS